MCSKLDGKWHLSVESAPFAPAPPILLGLGSSLFPAYASLMHPVLSSQSSLPTLPTDHTLSTLHCVGALSLLIPTAAGLPDFLLINHNHFLRFG